VQDASQAPHSGVSIGAMLSQRDMNQLAIKSVLYEIRSLLSQRDMNKVAIKSVLYAIRAL
jgi:hypothetical protein